jgi:penicillin-binding protein 1A
MKIITEARHLRHQVAGVLRRQSLPASPGYKHATAALVAAEDRRYFHHPGVDLIGILRAILMWVVRKQLSGASTIEQQLIRTLRGRYELTLRRKLSEICLALIVGRFFSKDELISAYLAVAYFGWQSTGLVRAAKRHEIILDTMTLEQAAYLVAMLKVPLPEHPSQALLERVARRARHIETLIEAKAR